MDQFIKTFQIEVHEAYQRMGSKLRNTVRTKNNVQGASTIFQRVGKGRRADGSVPPIDHTPVECPLYDFYAGDWVDRLDELKTSIDERQIIANAGAYALGRKTDELLLAELNKSTNFAGGDTDGLTKAKVLDAFEMMGDSDVPDDGQRFAVVGWKQWSQMLGIEEFASADYVGPDELPWRGTQAKRWLGTLWFPHSGLKATGNVRLCHWYHKTAIGHAAGADVKTDITRHSERNAHFVNNMMRQGAALIDPTGIVTLRCLEI